MGGYTRKNMFGLCVDYEDLISSLIDFLVEERGTTVLLIPHVFGEKGESDQPACEKMYERLRAKHANKLGLVRGIYDHHEIKYIIGQCDFFVGSRMHACIAALSQNIPAVAIAYSDKFVGVMNTVGVHFLVADARRMTKQEILETISQAYERRDMIRSQLQSRMPEIRQTVLALLAGLRMRTSERAALPSLPAKTTISSR
jgi:polysaccharide pyruvyl transferase WcaK-like protein